MFVFMLASQTVVRLFLLSPLLLSLPSLSRPFPFPSPPLPFLLSPLPPSPLLLSFLLSLSFPLSSPSLFPSSLLLPFFPPPPPPFLLPQVEQLAEEIQSLQQQLRSCLKDRTQVKTLQLIPGGQCLVYHIVPGKCPYPPTPQS